MIRILTEEGHYTVKRVQKLPKVGNANWLYAFVGPVITEFYRWDAFKKEYETIKLGATSYLELTDRPLGGELIGRTSDIPVNDGADNTSTYVEFDELSLVAISNNYNDLINKPLIPVIPEIPVIPTNTSAFVNDGSDSTSTYIEADDLAIVATTNNYNDLTNLPIIPVYEAIPDNTSAFINDGADGTSTYAEFDELSLVATSNNYNDLTNLPIIPAAVGSTSELINDGSDSTSTYVEADELGLVATTNNYNDLTNLPIIATVTNTSELINDGADGVNAFAVVGQVSLQDVIDVNKVADRVEFNKDVVNGGKLRGAFVYLVDSDPDPLDPTKTYIYGAQETYDTITSQYISRMNADGSLDASFVTGTGFNAFPYAGSEMLLADDGKLYVSGFFTAYNGTAANRIISLNPDGTVNTAFAYGTGFDNFTTGLAFNVAKTSIYVGGIFSTYQGVSYPRFAKILTTGAVDTGFTIGAGFDNTTIDILVNADDSLIVTGYFGNYKGVSAASITKILPNGDRDASFQSGTGFNTGNDQPNFVFRDEAGVLIAWGVFTLYNGTTANRIVALNEDGTIRNDGIYNFGTGFSDELFGFVRGSDGKYYIEGFFTNFNGVASSDGYIILNADFTVFKTFNEATYYYSTIAGAQNTYALLNVADYSQIFNISGGVPLLQKKLTFSEVTGKAEYIIGGINDTTSEEILPKRLIEQLIQQNGAASPLTTKGDLYTFSTVNASLPVGTDGFVLSANSETPTGLEWVTAPSGGGGSVGYKEVPTGLVNGTNTVFTIVNTAISIDFIWLYIDGVSRSNFVYDAGLKTITIGFAPAVGSVVEVQYISTLTEPFPDITVHNSLSGLNVGDFVHLTALEKTQADAAYAYSIEAHAPVDAQKNSNILKSEIEAVFTGEIATHTHDLVGQTGITQLATELKATAAATTTNVNWSDGVQFPVPMVADTTLTFSNIVQSKSILLVVTGNHNLTLPVGVDAADWQPDFVGTNTNYIQLYCVDSVTPVFLTTIISKA